VYGIHQATSGNAPGVRGETFSLSSFGVLGVNSSSDGGYGVRGQGYGGVRGEASGTFADGVYGSAPTGAAGFGVYGQGGAAGVKGTGYDGVRGTATGGAGIGVWGVGPGSGSNFAGYFTGNVQVTGTVSANAKNFKIDDPLDPAHKYLVHSSVESSEQMNVYSGNVTTDGKGFATVTMPHWFQALNRDFRYQLTILGRSFAQAIVWKEIANNRFTIRTNAPNVRISWQVTGVRHDPYANAHPLRVEQAKAANEQGKYLNPELYGKAKSAGIGYRPLPKPQVQR
jgi:hypothetical protein